MSKYLDNDGLLYLWNSKIKPLFQKAVNKEGDTMTGPLTLSGAPSNDLHAATKKYVVDSVSSAGGGDMLKSVYDTNDDGKVDKAALADKATDADTVTGFTVGVNVPANAKFTDTTYENASGSSAGLMSADDYTKLSAFGPASSYALKTDISSAYKYKGSKPTFSALPADGNSVGDVWNVEDTGMNYAWDGSAWDALGQTFEIQSITNGEIDEITA